MVKQYPHTGRIILPASSTKDATGNWTEGAESLDFETNCRAEPNSGSQYVVGQDGKQITYRCVVYMPILAAEIKPGTLFEVWDGERMIVRETVKQFSKGQLNSRVWL
jgi:hypothetical protein